MKSVVRLIVGGAFVLLSLSAMGFVVGPVVHEASSPASSLTSGVTEQEWVDLVHGLDHQLSEIDLTAIPQEQAEQIRQVRRRIDIFLMPQ